jgi:hypothetical protein
MGRGTEGVEFDRASSTEDSNRSSNGDLLGNYREIGATMRGNIALFETRHMTLYRDCGGQRGGITQEWKFRMKR